MDKNIRFMEERDIPVIAAAFAAQEWHKPESQYRRYFEEQQAGTRQVLILESDGEFAGYLTLLPTPSGGPWMGEDLPEVSDFNVLMKFQGRGYGWALMDAVEELAAKRWKRITLAVGLHNGYGTAQRMYVRRGYLPDGSGVWFGEGREPFTPYEPCVNDDSLVLYLSKELG